MNIFVLHPNPFVCAELLFKLDSVRARKQIVELCQMLAQHSKLPIPKADGSFYKLNKSIQGHPATKWVNACPNNRAWSIVFLEALLETYGKPHACQKAYNTLRLEVKVFNTPKFGWHSKKVSRQELSSDIFEAHLLYIQAKHKGLYSN